MQIHSNGHPFIRILDSDRPNTRPGVLWIFYHFYDLKISSAENLGFQHGHEMTFMNRSGTEKKAGDTSIHALLIREIARFSAAVLSIL